MSQSASSFGLHLTLDGYNGSKEKLADIKFVKRILNNLPKLLQMRKISPVKAIWYDGGSKPEDCGVSGYVLIAESHISIHTFSKKGFLTADVYSCKEFDSEATIDFLKSQFELAEIEVNLIRRGLKFPR